MTVPALRPDDNLRTSHVPLPTPDPRVLSAPRYQLTRLRYKDPEIRIDSDGRRHSGFGACAIFAIRLGEPQELARHEVLELLWGNSPNEDRNELALETLLAEECFRVAAWLDDRWHPASFWWTLELTRTVTAGRPTARETNLLPAEPDSGFRNPELSESTVAEDPPANEASMTIERLAARMRKVREAPLTGSETKSPQRAEAAYHIEAHLSPDYAELLSGKTAKIDLMRLANYSGVFEDRWSSLVYNGKSRIADAGKACRFCG